MASNEDISILNISKDESHIGNKIHTQDPIDGYEVQSKSSSGAMDEETSDAEPIDNNDDSDSLDVSLKFGDSNDYLNFALEPDAHVDEKESEEKNLNIDAIETTSNMQDNAEAILATLEEQLDGHEDLTAVDNPKTTTDDIKGNLEEIISPTNTPMFKCGTILGCS